MMRFFVIAVAILYSYLFYIHPFSIYLIGDKF